jgi:hypothetical protein
VKQAFAFGQWAPDLPPYRSEALVTLINALPTPNGYRPLRGPSAITEALAPPFAGGAAYVGSDGTGALLAGNEDGINRYSGGWNLEVPEASTGRWRFAQFGDLVIAVDGTDPVKYDIIAGSGGDLGGTPPAASLVATVRDFVWLAGDPAAIQTLSISGFNDAEGWTFGTNQATQQPFPDGGAITGLVGGEYGIVFQRGAVKRGTYVGGEVIWQFDEISSNIGCIAPGSIAQAGRLVFFLSERGFMICDGTDVKPIGNERVDRTFFAAFPRADLDRMYAAVDPRNSLVFWAMPGSPGALYIYNWTLDRWAYGSFDIQGVFAGFSANVSLEGLDILYPGGLETMPSLDDPAFAGGDPLLLVVTSDGTVNVLLGDNLPATFETAQIEPMGSDYAKITNTRPMTDADEMTISLASRAKQSGEAVVVSTTDVRGIGNMPLRANGRTHQVTLAIDDAEWSYVQGIELEYGPGGSR